MKDIAKALVVGVIVAFALSGVAVTLNGCAGAGKVPITFEACFVDERYGTVCATYSADKGLFIKTNVTTDEVRERIEEWARSLGWKGD